MTGRKQALGKRGEDLAAAHLQSLGFRVVERNFRTRQGEVDLVVRRDGHLCFVEVKSWSGRRFGDPEEWIPPWKRRRLASVAAAWLARHEPDFDEVTVGAVLIRWEADRPAFTFLEDALEGT